METDCGLPYSHDQHVYTTRNGIKVCDGDLDKRREAVSRIANETKQRAHKEAQNAGRESKKQKAFNRKRNKRRRRK